MKWTEVRMRHKTHYLNVKFKIQFGPNPHSVGQRGNTVITRILLLYCTLGIASFKACYGHYCAFTVTLTAGSVLI